MANPLGFIANSDFIRRVKHFVNAGSSGGSAAAAKRILSNITKSKGLALPELGRLNELEGAGSFDIASIEAAYNNESIVRQAIDKYVDLMFKAGWTLTGKNQASVDYIKMRLALIAEGTGIPTEQLFIEMAEDFVLYHNVFLLKARQSNNYQFPPGIKVAPVNNNPPVIGLFPLPPSTITIKRSERGDVTQYQQEANNTKITFKPTDVVHIFRQKPRGKAFGVPFLAPVINDIKILRVIEEMIGKLIYKETFPVYIYTVGTNELPSTNEELQDAQAKVESMSLDGMLFLPERHSLDVVGSEGKVLNIQQYLDYFEQRVYTGLGMSETLMGQGATSSKSTADNLTAQLNDKIKAFQKTLSVAINQKILYEMLIEGGFDPVLSPDDAVSFSFKEIDLDNKIKLENQAIQKFTQNAITHEELRAEMGMDPVSDESRLFFNMVTGAISDRDAQNAMAAAAAKTANAVTPTNQHTTQSVAPTKTITEQYKESILDKCSNIPKDRIADYADRINAVLESAKEDLISHYGSGAPDDAIGLAYSLTVKSITEHVNKYANVCFFNAVNSAARMQLDITRSPYVEYNPSKTAITERFINPMIQVLSKDLKSAIEESDRSVAAISSLFDIYANRAIYILRDVGFASYNYGIIALAKKMNIKSVYVKNLEDSDCHVCNSYQNKRIDISDDLIVPPYHNHCVCMLAFKE